MVPSQCSSAELSGAKQITVPGAVPAIAESAGCSVRVTGRLCEAGPPAARKRVTGMLLPGPPAGEASGISP